MQIKSIVAGAAIALIAGVGFASAADDQYTTDVDDQFTAIAGVEAEALTAQELDDTRGAAELLENAPIMMCRGRVRCAFKQDKADKLPTNGAH